jgi:hypothetical protein
VFDNNSNHVELWPHQSANTYVYAGVYKVVRNVVTATLEELQLTINSPTGVGTWTGSWGLHGEITCNHAEVYDHKPSEWIDETPAAPPTVLSSPTPVAPAPTIVAPPVVASAPAPPAPAPAPATGNNIPLVQPREAPVGQAVGASERTVVAMVPDGGTFAVPVTINDQLTLKFIVDSGAADVSIPADVVGTLVRTETITAGDFLGKQTYQMADGSTIPSQRFVIRTLKVGDKTLENVTGSIAPATGSLLLGQSFLSRFKLWSIDNQAGALILN